MSANSTGLFQDIPHSDSVVAGDDFDYAFNPGSNQFLPMLTFQIQMAIQRENDTLSNFNTSVTTYSGLSGVFDTTETSETNAQVTINNISCIVA